MFKLTKPYILILLEIEVEETPDDGKKKKKGNCGDGLEKIAIPQMSSWTRHQDFQAFAPRNSIGVVVNITSIFHPLTGMLW